MIENTQTATSHFKHLYRNDRAFATRNALKSGIAPQRQYECLEDALALAFCWHDSPEGHEYWEDVHNALADGTYDVLRADQKSEEYHWHDDSDDYTTAPLPESICEEAQRIQGGDRQQDYGSPAKNFQDIADLWSAYLKVALDVDIAIKARDVAHMSILMKVSRNVHKPKRDNWVDMAGYAQCGGKVDEL
tara:strand:+ start:853 stop:1422 length:570 start_codon:yes stop_codon:yes gene_type:complete